MGSIPIIPLKIAHSLVIFPLVDRPAFKVTLQRLLLPFQLALIAHPLLLSAISS
jgi:hypothetical protein